MWRFLEGACADLACLCSVLLAASWGYAGPLLPEGMELS